MILHKKFISMKNISLYKYAPLQKQAETTIEIWNQQKQIKM